MDHCFFAQLTGPRPYSTDTAIKQVNHGEDNAKAVSGRGEDNEDATTDTVSHTVRSLS